MVLTASIIAFQARGLGSNPSIRSKPSDSQVIKFMRYSALFLIQVNNMNTITNNTEVINHFDNVYCELRPSNIQGIGVFAIRDIPYGINPFSNPDILDDPYYETIIDMNKIPEDVLPLVHRFCYVDNNHAFIPRLGFNYVSLLRYLNHF